MHATGTLAHRHVFAASYKAVRCGEYRQCYVHVYHKHSGDKKEVKKPRLENGGQKGLMQAV